MRFPGRGVRAGGTLGGLGARGAVCGVVCAGRLGSERGWSNRGAGCSSHSQQTILTVRRFSFPLPGPSGSGRCLVGLTNVEVGCWPGWGGRTTPRASSLRLPWRSGLGNISSVQVPRGLGGRFVLQILGPRANFLEGPSVPNRRKLRGNNRSVMPLDVLGRTRATLIASTSLQLKLCNPLTGRSG